jgi:hypothetical protein
MPAPAAEPWTLESTIFGIRRTVSMKGVVVLQQLADHRRDGIVGCGGANRLQIAAGREGAAFALDDKHADIVVALDLRAELLELLRDRQIDRIEGRGPVQGDGGNRTLDPEQGGALAAVSSDVGMAGPRLGTGPAFK